MKKKILALAAAFLLIAVNLYAEGNLFVEGNVGIGATTPYANVIPLRVHNADHPSSFISITGQFNTGYFDGLTMGVSGSGTNSAFSAIHSSYPILVLPNSAVHIDGGLRLNTTKTRPDCDGTTRGMFWFTESSTSTVDDTLEICAYLTSDYKYLWRTVSINH